MPSTPPSRTAAELPSTPPTPPLPSAAENSSTPPISPQRYQQAACDQKHSQRHIGSPEQRRIPAIPSHPPALPPVIVDGHELNHLSLDMRMHMINIPPHPLWRCGHAPPPPLPFLPPPSPPPPAGPVASGSAITNLFFPLPPIIPTPPPRQTLNSAQLRELYVPPILARPRERPSISYISLLCINIADTNDLSDHCSYPCPCSYSCSCSCPSSCSCS